MSLSSRSNLTPENHRKIGQVAAILAPLFARQEWTWATAKNGIPTEEEIAKNLTELAECALGYAEGSSCATGRLRATHEEDGDVRLSLELGTLWAEWATGVCS